MQQGIKKVVTFFAAIAMVLGMASTVSAEVIIDVDWHGDKNAIVNEKNMKPGDSIVHDITVKNVGEPQDLYFKIEDLKNKKFASQLKVYLIDKSSGKYYIGGSGDRFTLDELYKEGSVFVERLETGEKNRYTLKIKFNEDAGNEFQRQKTSFDIRFGFKGKPTTTTAPLPLRAGQIAGGNPAPAGEVLGAETESDGEETIDTNGTVAGSEATSSDSTSGEVRGAQSCSNLLPWWLWVLFLGALFGINAAVILKRMQRRNALVISVLALVGALVAWYFFDNCRVYWWFVIGSLIITGGGIVLYGVSAQERGAEKA